jgi:NitT/TauT family transport system ATP-binding protein
MKNAISIAGMHKWFQEGTGKRVTAFQDINLTIRQGEFFVMVGPSGCGKSTLLRIMSGLDTQSSGTMEFAPGVSRRDIGFVFQNFALLPWLTVSQNIEMSLIGKGVDAPQRRKIVSKELEQFGLSDFADAYVHDLSGGMRQRVGLARAFAVEPMLLFMDEPFSALDSFTAEELRKDLLQLWHERGTTIVMVTHIIAEALELADRIAVMTSHPGTVEAIIKNTLPRPRNLRSSEAFKLEDKIRKLIR